MGQKVNPVGMRLGVNRTWDSRWYARGEDYRRFLREDMAIRGMLKEKLRHASVSRVVIERTRGKCVVRVHTARPGVVIGRKGADIEKIRRNLVKLTGGEGRLDLVEVRKPELDARLIAQNIAEQLERRMGFRRAMKRAVQGAMRMGAQGIRVNCAGRLGGAEMSRTEWYREGRVPLHTLRADVDYSMEEARTVYGVCGVKVWVFRGEIMEHDPSAQERRAMELQTSAVRGGEAGGARAGAGVGAGVGAGAVAEPSAGVETDADAVKTSPPPKAEGETQAEGAPQAEEAPKAEGEPKAKVATKAKGAPKAGGTPKAKGTTKAGGAPKAKGPPKAEGKPKAKGAPKAGGATKAKVAKKSAGEKSDAPGGAEGASKDKGEGSL